MKNILSLVLISSVLFSCSEKKNEKISEANHNTSLPVSDYFNYDNDAVVKTGGVHMVTIDGKYKVWTKRIGNGIENR